MREGKIEKTVAEWAKNNNWITYKLGGLGDKGKPDRVFLHRSITLFIEFKATGKTASKLQLWHSGQLAHMGYAVHFVDNIADGICILQTAGEPYE